MGGRAWLVVAVALLLGCSSAWETHQKLETERRDSGDVEGAIQVQKWLVEHAFREAPATEQGPAYDADRLLQLGDMLGQTNDVRGALEVYIEVLRLDPRRAEDVLTSIGLLPLPQAQRDALLDEFTRNALSLDPSSPIQMGGRSSCWSYLAHEIRLREIWTTKGPDGLERHANYDSRSWIYDPAHDQWHTDGDWMKDAGAEIQPVDGAANPRYRAILDADRGFYTDVAVPPCHLAGWRGPYDSARRKIFVTDRLPKRQTGG